MLTRRGIDYQFDLFQFHEGPIKTELMRQSRQRVQWFQFHEGPIKTHRCRDASYTREGFNSMKVRLKRVKFAKWSLRLHVSIP